MASDRDKNVLEKHLLDYCQLHQSTFFMHDGAPCHTSKSVTTWLQERTIPLLEWPGNSPDLNPIDNVWHEMKRKLSTHDTSTVYRLQEETKRMWQFEMDGEYFQILAESIPKRLQLVIKCKANMTKY
ncbi:Transposable element Tcb1 transposase-like 2 [Homarus americanus]|uniref:Transposable element Tcb1 transposase-like 2 n=1 Tax=Homarus americanus TaxID=6706 RepID=A0A8J5JGN7_HOMAM|nr:Transposable element Tcb1 transposase-like 2 [Homarus americanus]